MPVREQPELFLGIETSCDDTCVAIVQKGHKILANMISSQNQAHCPFGGIVPEIAARKHLEKMTDMVEACLKKAKISLKDVQAIAVTNRPGLASSLLVGVAFSKALSFALKIPLIAINHMEGHLYSCRLEYPDLPFPHICLAVSGGHTLLVLVEKDFQYHILANTTDDAAGEAFDKVARYLGLEYPGGPAIDRLAQENQLPPVVFPSPKIHSKTLEFSFSGIKTAVKYYVESLDKEQLKQQISAIAAGFQQAMVKVLVDKTIKAALEYNIDTITLSGGVAANTSLRSEMSIQTKCRDIRIYYPSLSLCSDNAAMIAGLAYYKFISGTCSDYSLTIRANSTAKCILE